MTSVFVERLFFVLLAAFAAPLALALDLPASGGVLVMSRTGKDGRYCSGVAVTDRWVLTAARCCGEKTTQVIPVPGSFLGHEPETQIATICKKAPGTDAEDAFGARTGLALVGVPKALPSNVRPAGRFVEGQIVRQTAALTLKDKGPRYLTTLSASSVEANYVGYHGSEASGGQRVTPVTARLGVLGFDLAASRAVFVVKDKGDDFDLLGPGVFLDDAGTMKLIGVVQGIVTGGDQTILLATDVRPFQKWIDEVVAKAP